MLRINRKVWTIIEKNNLENVQVLTNINRVNPSVSVLFSSRKDYKIFVKQFEYKFGLASGKLFPERLEVKCEW